MISLEALESRKEEKKKATGPELRKEEEKEKSQNHEGDLYLLHCILLFNFLFQYYEQLNLQLGLEVNPNIFFYVKLGLKDVFS